ncbi:hypothetical protein nbrc107696_11850 [Gordonia spumicola]|uniref:Secreted protein n=1 Tax=Gordonia spumicola TaxID=589161 RepID=A0A7I9V5Q1_9ACTN|nr:hypothetical protein [Gordonia spumicola]GEE00739.1 hypothetical protein nbrc107696_11850 [Gordonia spumicola]
MRAIHSSSTRLICIVVALVAAVSGLVAVAPAQAAPLRTALPLGQYQGVNASRFTSYSYADRGRVFFAAAGRQCQIGPTPGNVACSGKTKTAPPRTVGVSITGDMQGPYWIPRGTSYRFGSAVGFRAPVLHVGQRITVANVSCAVPKSGVIACSTINRAFVLTPSTHRFYYPRGDRRHDGNPKH